MISVVFYDMAALSCYRGSMYCSGINIFKKDVRTGVQRRTVKRTTETAYL